MQYLEKVLKLKIQERKCKMPPGLPYAYNAWYDFRCAELLCTEVLFVYLKAPTEDVRLTISHMEYLKRLTKHQVVFVSPNMTARQRDVLIDNGVAFVVENKQVYLPFVGVLLKKQGDIIFESLQKFQPSTQLMFLYYIYKKQESMYLQDAVNDLKFSNMTGFRCLQQMENVGLMTVTKDGVRKVMRANLCGKALFEQALPYLQTPVKKSVYIDNGQIENLCIAGESALSMCTMLEHPSVVCYAGHGESNFSNYVYENERNLYQVKLEFWKYDPKLFGNGGTVDVLSLYLSLRDSQDERIQECLEEMMKKFWGWYDGTRATIF